MRPSSPTNRVAAAVVGLIGGVLAVVPFVARPLGRWSLLILVPFGVLLVVVAFAIASGTAPREKLPYDRGF